MHEKMWLSLLLALLLWCIVPAGALCAPVTSNPVSIVFQSDGSGGDPDIRIEQPEGFVEVGQNTITSLVPVAQPGTYVELFADNQSVAGAWSDAEGKASFLSLSPVGTDTSLRFVQRSSQTLSVPAGSTHQITRPGSAGANPGLAVFGNALLLGFESGAGGISSAVWNWQSGLREGGAAPFSRPPGQYHSPRPVADPAGQYVWMYFERPDSRYHYVYRARLGSQTDTIVHTTLAPCDIAISSSVGGQVVYFTGSIYGYITEYHCMHTGSQGSSWTYLKSPPSLSNLSALSAPDGYTWVAGEEDGTVFLYRGALQKRQVPGTAPALSRVNIGGTDYICLTYLASSGVATDPPVLYSQCFTVGGSMAGTPKQVMTMPTGTLRMATVGRAGSQMVVFWDQPFQGQSHIFYTTVSVVK